jgi:excisionase family DNA binding protein
VSVDAAAKSLSITRRELYRRIGLGELPSVRIGRRRLIEVAELDAYVARLREAVA